MAAILILVMTFAIGVRAYRQFSDFAGQVVSWTPDGRPYEVHDLAGGKTKRLSAQQYSADYAEIGYDLTFSGEQLTVSVYENGQETICFSATQYACFPPVLLDSCVYFTATQEINDRETYYLWEYRDGRIKKLMETPVRRDTPVVLSDSRLILSTQENQMVIYDIPTETVTPMCQGLRPCYAEQEGSVYFIEPSGWKLSRYDLYSGQMEVLNIRCADFCRIAYSYENRALLVQVDNGKGQSYSILNLETGHHTVFSLPFRFLMGWWKITHLNGAEAIWWIG